MADAGIQNPGRGVRPIRRERIGTALALGPKGRVSWMRRAIPVGTPFSENGGCGDSEPRQRGSTNSPGANWDSACAGPEGPSLMDETSNPRGDAIFRKWRMRGFRTPTEGFDQFAGSELGQRLRWARRAE